VPGDVSVIGYDDSPLIPMTNPPLTTVRQPVTAIARSAVTTLLAAIAGEDVPDGEMFFSPDLIVRGSTGPAPKE
ncbi:MAG: LacI family transcriptional regulator, partial [Actinomyces urogenitalis DORA_12]